MNSPDKTISDLEDMIAEKLCLKIENWNLYLGDAGLARKLAIECLSNLSKGVEEAINIGLNSIFVSLGDGNNSIPLAKFIIKSQVKELEDILDEFL
tara:strand:+ start:2511 stop:2798 length:288 start_codon:yes stop_codon:yes gene_type:complete